MKPTPPLFPSRFARHALLAGCAVHSFLLTGCGEEPRSIELTERTEEPRQRRRPERPSPRLPRRNSSAPAPAPQAAAEPAATPEPTPVPDPVVLSATAMRITGAGTSDTLGGVFLGSNGALQTDHLSIPFPVKEVRIEMKGEPAKSVWPVVDLNAYNRTTQTNYFPMTRTSVDVFDYQVYRLPQNPPLAPGDYFITFRYYNNQDFPDTREDRSVSLRKIEFLPESGGPL